jgi:hypothetical protein
VRWIPEILVVEDEEEEFPRFFPNFPDSQRIEL